MKRRNIKNKRQGRLKTQPKYSSSSKDYSLTIDTQRNRRDKFELIPELYQYKRNQKSQAILNEADKIKARLQVQNTANKLTKQRENNGDYYLNYNFNPFTSIKKDAKKQIMKQISKFKGLKLIDVVDLLNTNQQPKVNQSVSNVISQFKDLRTDYDLRSRKVIANLKRNEQNNRKKIKFGLNNTMQVEIQNNQLTQQVQTPKNKQLYQSQIQDLVQFQQKNHFFLKRKFNIFKFARGQIDQVTALDKLKKNNFSLNSMIERNFKFRLPIYRDLSTLGRGAITNTYHGKQRILDYVFSDQTTLNTKQLTYGDVLSLASNRISPEALEQILFSVQSPDKIEGSQSSSLDQQGQVIIYKRNNQSKLVNHVGIDEALQEVQTYKMLPYADRQKQFDDAKQKQKNEILQMLKYENYLVKNTINDKKLNFKLSNQTKQAIKKYIHPKTDKDKQMQLSKTVRMKKLYSNRQNLIKFSSFNKFLSQKNQLVRIKAEMARKRYNKQNIQFS